MICPNKICQKEIPDDSIFCDICGVRIRQCTQCGFIVLGKFCPKCGGVVSERSIIDDSATDKDTKQNIDSLSDIAQDASTSSKNDSDRTKQDDLYNEEQAPSSTSIIAKNKELSITHGDIVIKAQSCDILGRTTGPHSKVLGQFPVISSKHAKVEYLNNEWYISDLHSSNKSYLNGKPLTPLEKAKLSDGDTLLLANISFKVSIK